jgi:hypothetical protein
MRSTLFFVLALTTVGCNCGSAPTHAFAQLEVSPPSVDFGAAQVGQTVARTVTLTNTGRAVATVNALSVGGVDATSFKTLTVVSTVAAGASVDVVIDFLPQAVGPRSGRLVIDSDAENAPQLLVPLAGDGVCEICSTDAGTPDAGQPDAGPDDGGAPDAATFDAGTFDAGSDDAGAPDAGAPDAGVPDAGVPDAGVPDAGVPDAGVPDAGCPPDMATLQSGGCVDRYEASIGAGGEAVSAPQVLPWLSLTTAQAQTACTLAGKHLCSETEWQIACSGPQGLLYPYGNTYSTTACNGLDKGLGVIVPTAQVMTCVGGYPGVFDMSGNAYERTATCAGGTCRIRGGSYRSGAGAGLLKCTTGFDFPEGSGDPAVGFRCCR